MKIERISESQIRCTLNKDDLLDRELKISELAYGTEKARALFQDLIQQASYECGFEAEDIPLMIEAIPGSPECLVLVVTKVEDPEELDTRFSNFTPYGEPENEQEPEEPLQHAYADEILNCFDQLGRMLNAKEQELRAREASEKAAKKTTETAESADPALSVPSSLVKVYSFRTLAHVTALADIIAPFYHGQNSLYKDPVQSYYYLVIRISGHTPEEFNKVCNIASEYGRIEQTNYATLSYYEEHYEPVIRDRAVEILHQL